MRFDILIKNPTILKKILQKYVVLKMYVRCWGKFYHLGNSKSDLNMF